MNIPEEVLLTMASESPAFRLFLVNHFMLGREIANKEEHSRRAFRTEFLDEARGNKIAGIKRVRSAIGLERQRLCLWASELGVRLAWFGGEPPGLADSKRFVEAAIERGYFGV